MQPYPPPPTAQPFSTRMPQLVPCDVLHAPGLIPTTHQPSTSDPALQQHLRRLAMYLKDKFHSWRVDNDFQFDLPVSNFQFRREKPEVKLHKKEVEEGDYQRKALTNEQLESVKESGEFNAFVREGALPNRWHVSQILYKGRKKTCDSLHANLGFCFDILYNMKQRTIGSQWFSLRTRSWNLLNYFTKLTRLFVGLPATTKSGYFVDPHLLLQLDRHMQIYDTYWNTFDKTLFQFLRLDISLQGQPLRKSTEQLTQREMYLMGVCDKFIDAWEERFEQIKMEVTDRLPQEQFEEICGRERGKVEQRVIQELMVDQRIFNHMKFLVEEQQTIRDVTNEYKLRIRRSQKALRSQMEEHYTIKKYSEAWFDHHFSANIKQLRLQNDQQMLDKMRRKLRNPHFATYSNMLKDYTQKLDYVKSQTAEYKPSRVFVNKYRLFSPYRVECYDSVHYQIIKEDQITVMTDHCGWRLTLYAARYVCWVKNTMHCAWRRMTVGRLGIMNLFGTRRFYPVHMVNPDTGEVGRYPGIERVPVATEVGETCQYVSESRAVFQAEADTGLCSKVIGRLFNLFFLYFIVLFLYGFLYLMILKPIIILAVSFFYLSIFLTAWLWIPIFLLIHYLFSILVYNLDHDYLKDQQNEFSQVWFPLITSTIKFMLDAVVLLAVFMVIVVSPLAAVCFVGLAIVRYLLRRVYDTITFGFIRCCARQPRDDSWIAWRVAGPGVSKNFYQTMNEEDLYVLVLAELEKIRLQLYQQYVTDKLNQPLLTAKNISSQFSSTLNTSPNFIDPVQSPIFFYINKLNAQIQDSKRVYPPSPGTNIRFTQDQLDLYTANTKKMIKQLVQRYPTHDIFGVLKVKSKRYDKAVLALWERIFKTEEVFERLENIEERFQVVREREEDVQTIFHKINRDFRLITKEEFEEEGHFMYKPVVKVRQGEEVSDEAAMFQKISYKDVIQYIKDSSAENLPVSAHSPQYSIIPNLNIRTIYERNKAAGNLLD